jgi:anti-anti-sigma regulatory factor
MQLTLTLHRPDPTTVVLRPVGEIDALTAPRFERWLAENLVFHARVVLDLARLPLGSREGLDILERAELRAARQHVELVVLAPGANTIISSRELEAHTC